MPKVRLDLRTRKNEMFADLTVDASDIPQVGEFLQVENQQDPENGEESYFRITHMIWMVGKDDAYPLLRGKMVSEDEAGTERKTPKR